MFCQRLPSKRKHFASSNEEDKVGASGTTANMSTPIRNNFSPRLSRLLCTTTGSALTTNVSITESLPAPSTFDPNNTACLLNPQLPYVDCGNCDHVCEYCGALFWFDERLISSSQRLPPKYTTCCKGGAIRLPNPLEPPATFKDLFSDSRFLDSIRAYNSMFSMTSFGAEIDETINHTRGPYVFKVSGQISHWLGSICPLPTERPRFLQMYIYDTDNEIENRMRFFSGRLQSDLSSDVVATISRILTSCNEYVRIFKSAKDLCVTSNVPMFSIRLYNGKAERTYEPPAPGTLGAIICDKDCNSNEYDIIIRTNDNTPQRVSKLHSSYMPLQYPLLFPFGEQGWSPDLRLHSTQQSYARKLTMNMYYSYLLHDRHGLYTHLLKGGRLFQQFLVDAYVCVEQYRLDYINANQNLFRCEYLRGIHDAIARGDTEGRDVGKRIFLPSSFTGGPRYMYKHYQDALAICRVYGNPQYFITFTCNVKWPEIRRHLSKVGCANAADRPDIITRVFQMKVDAFIKFLRLEKPFGTVTAGNFLI